MVFTHLQRLHAPPPISALPVNPQNRLRILEDEPSTPYPIHSKGARIVPHSHHIAHHEPQGCPGMLSHHVPCRRTTTGARTNLSPPPIDALHPREKNTSAHTRGVSLPEPGSLPTPHPSIPTSHLHAAPPRECAGARDMRARQTRAHGPGRHRRAPITPTSATRTQTVTRAPPHPHTTTEHVLDESTRNPRATSSSAPPITPCAAIDTRTAHHENPTRTHSHCRPPKRSHHYTPWTSRTPTRWQPDNPTTYPPLHYPPPRPHRRLSLSNP